MHFAVGRNSRVTTVVSRVRTDLASAGISGDCPRTHQPDALIISVTDIQIAAGIDCYPSWPIQLALGRRAAVSANTGSTGALVAVARHSCDNAARYFANAVDIGVRDVEVAGRIDCQGLRRVELSLRCRATVA